MSNDERCAVLVIDDDVSIGEEVCEALELRKCRALYAEDITKARASLACDGSLSVVVVDYNMPQMNGVEVIETLTKEVARPLAFIVLTGDDTQAAAASAVRARAFDFLRKPVEGRLLAETVHRAAAHLTQAAEIEGKHSRIESESKALAQRLDAISEKLNHRDNILRGLLLSGRSPVGTIAEEIRAPLMPLLEHLKELKGAIDNSGDSAPSILTSIVQDGQKLADVIDDILPSGSDGSAEPAQFSAVDLAVIVHRLVPALERLATLRKIRFKTRFPGRLPFLCADENKFVRALTNISGALIGALSSGDSLTITAIKERHELVVTYRIVSPQFNKGLVSTLVQDLPSTIKSLDEIKPDTLKLVESRIVVHLHGGRIRFDEGAEGQCSLRMFFPLTEEELAPELRLMSR